MPHEKRTGGAHSGGAEGESGPDGNTGGPNLAGAVETLAHIAGCIASERILQDFVGVEALWMEANSQRRRTHICRSAHSRLNVM